MDLGRMIRKQVREAVDAAIRSGKAGGANIAAAANIGKSGKRTVVYSTDDVTIVQRDGKTHVIRHDEEEDSAAE